MSSVSVVVEDDAVPIVRVFAARFRRAAHHEDFVRTARAMDGSIALRSSKDPQALTVTVRHGTISLRRGADAPADLRVTLDFDTGKIKSARGWWRHPRLALQASRLLADYPTDWQSAAADFWTKARDLPGMPAGLVITCEDDSAELVVGDPQGAVEIEGKRDDLVALFTGEAIFIDSAMRGRIRTACGMQHLTVLSEATKLNLLGELR